jgi:dTMP kinase
VLRSIDGVDEPRAWALRARLADTCKEVLDGITGMASDAAWALRVRLADRWPSTAVKSLGELGLGSRGRALIVDILQRHPCNVSLLKHAASAARDDHQQGSTCDPVRASS